MASKYSAVFARLTKVLNTDPSHQAKIDVIKQMMRADPNFKLHASALASEYAALRREKDIISAQLSETQVRLDATFQLMAEQFEAEGMTAMTAENGDNIRIQPKISIAFPDPEAFRQWCLADADLARSMRLMPQTAISLISQVLLDGAAEPPGAKASFYDQAVWTKGK